MAPLMLAGCRHRAIAGCSRLISSTIRSSSASCSRSFAVSSSSCRRRMDDMDDEPANASSGDNLSWLDSLTSESVIFSGIQPTGTPHIGNYFGAMRMWKQMQDRAPAGAKLLFSIVDLHAITMPQDAEVLKQRKLEMAAALMAIGINPDKSIIFFQSDVKEHAELMWILSCTASMGYLNRMTQWKSKMRLNDLTDSVDKEAQGVKLGLFAYPVLQAADILVHRATHVPVGHDQAQHLEFSRECVTNFNSTYKTDCLVPPKTIMNETPRIMSLKHPMQKMSKSSPNEKSRISIIAGKRAIRADIAGAVTDSLNEVTYDPVGRPGVANLLNILAQCRGPSAEGCTTPEQCADMLAGAPLGHLKDMVADALIEELGQVSADYHYYLRDKGGKRIHEMAQYGAQLASQSAQETMRLVRDAVGLADRVHQVLLPTQNEGKPARDEIKARNVPKTPLGIPVPKVEE